MGRSICSRTVATPWSHTKLDSYKVRIAPGAVSGEIHLDVLDLRQRLSEVVSLTSNQ